MSHFTTINTQIKDVEALRATVKEIGLELLCNADARGFSTMKTHGTYVIRLKGPYDIAVNKQPDGTFGLTTDWFAGYVEKEVGPQFGRLLQLYGVHKTTQEARKKGYLVQRKTQPNGSIKLILQTV